MNLALITAFLGLLQTPPHNFDNPIPFDTASNKYVYQSVIEHKEASAANLYSNVKAWLIQKDMKADFKVDTEDKQLVLQRYFTVRFEQKRGKIPIEQHIIYDAVFDFKEGRCRYTFSNIRISSSTSGTTEDWTLEYYVKTDESIPGLPGAMVKKGIQQNIEASCNATHSEFTKVITELEAAIVGNTKDDDW